MKISQPYAAITLDVKKKNLQSFVRLSPLMVTSNILEQVPEITAGDCNVLACQMTSRRTETAADNPKNKRQNF